MHVLLYLAAMQSPALPAPGLAWPGLAWHVYAQVDLTLVAEQARADFRPGESDPLPSFDLPTGACASVTALLGATAELAQLHLHGANLASFHAEVGGLPRLG